MNFGYYKINNYTLYIEADGDYITKIELCNESKNENTSTTITNLKDQLDLYFAGKIKEFNINYKVNYLSWRQELYKHIKSIPYGEQKEIKALLPLMGLSKGVGAIARAINDNPLIIIIPCHRVNSIVRRLKAHSYPKEFRQFLLSVEQNNL